MNKINYQNTVILKTLDVPIINTSKHLCEILSITKQSLFFLTYKKDSCYSVKKIHKKDGTERLLHVPNLYLKVVQRWILKEILEKICVSKQAVAFVPKKNGLKDNAERHKEKLFILEMDITNFFGSIKKKQIYRLFSSIGYNNNVANILAELCTYNDELPQGAVTSPYLANLICFHMDSRINGYCSRRDIVYTRYADDLAFSSDNRTFLNKTEKFIKYIVEDEGFLINDKKTRYLSNYVKKTITGITINNNSIHVDKNLKKCLRAQIFQSIKTRNYMDNDIIRGKIAFINSIEDGFKDNVIKYIQHISKKTYFINDPKIVDAYNKNKLYPILPDMKLDDKL